MRRGSAVRACSSATKNGNAIGGRLIALAKAGTDRPVQPPQVIVSGCSVCATLAGRGVEPVMSSRAATP